MRREQLFFGNQNYFRNTALFFAHTGDDRVPAEGSVLAYLALEKAGVNGNEPYVYPFGGHGYGMRKTDNPVSQWPIVPQPG